MGGEEINILFNEIRNSQMRLELGHTSLHHQLEAWMENADWANANAKNNKMNKLNSYEQRIHCAPSIDLIPPSPLSKSSGLRAPFDYKPTSSEIMKSSGCQESKGSSEVKSYSRHTLPHPPSARSTEASNSHLLSPCFERHSHVVKSSLTKSRGIASIKIQDVASSEAPVRATKISRPPTREFDSYNKTRMFQIVTSTAFVLTFSIAIIANAILIGAEVNHNASNADELIIFKIAQCFFFTLFLVELLLRMFAFRTLFLRGKSAYWNIFDMVMVGLSIVEILEVIIPSISNSSSGGVSRVFRIARMARVIRIFRVLRFSPQLRMMLFLILESVKSLGWLVVLLISFLYLFSVIFTMGFTEYVGVSGSENYQPDRQYASAARNYYGSVWKSLYTCFRSMAGGLTWGEAVEPLQDMDMAWFYVSVFLLFIVFSVLCFMNIVTGVFVDGALEKSKNDRDMVIEKQLNQKKAYIENLRDIFLDTDEDGNGTISREEFQSYMSEERVQAYFASLKVDTSDISALFHLLDKDHSGEIDFDEFVDNLLHIMRAQAPEQMVAKILKDTREMRRDMVYLRHYVKSGIETMERDLRSFQPSLAEHSWCKLQRRAPDVLKSPREPFVLGTRFSL